jgi:hypothetical protein
MGGATLSTLSNVMKYYYLGPVQKQFADEILINQLLGISNENLVGLQAVLPLHDKRSGGIGSRGELEDLPAASAQGYQKAVYDLAYHYGRAQVSGQAIHKTSNSAGAFIQAMKSEIDGLKDDLALDFARQVYGTGDGVVAAFAANSTTTTLTLTSAEAITKGFLYINMVIDIGDTTNPQSVAAARTITDVDPATPSITISGANVTTTTSHRVFRAGNAGPSTTYALKEMDAGLQKMFPNAANTVGNIDSTAAGNKFWDCLRKNVGGAISLAELMYQWNRSAANGAKVGDVVAITTPGITRRLFETGDFKSLVQFVNQKDFVGGFTEISFAVNGLPIKLYPDRLAPWGKVMILDKKHVRMFSPADWAFLSRDGLTVRWVSDKDAYQVALFRYANMGTDLRRTSNVLYAVTDTDGC